MGDGDGITSKHSMPRRGGTHEITFRVLIDTNDMEDVALIVNTGKATASGMTYDFGVESRIPPEVRETEFDVPTTSPTDQPTIVPTTSPTDEPTDVPTTLPTDQPTDVPTEDDTENEDEDDELECV